MSPKSMASFVLQAVAAYGVVGVLIGAAFAFYGVSRVDHAATGGPFGFRLMIWPASAALWPYIAFRWLRAARGNA